MIIENNIRKKIINGLKWTTVSAGITSLINIIIPFYLAIHIEPTEFGRLAIVMVIYGFLNMFFRPAFGLARIQKSKIYESKTLDDIEFTINFVKALFLSFLLYGLIGAINNYYNSSFSDLIYILIFTNLISAYRSPKIYLLSKKLMFRELNLLEIIPKIAGTIVSLFLAITTKDISSILYGMLMSSFIRVLTSQYYIPYRYRFSIQFKRLLGIYRFSIWVMIERLLRNLSSNVDKIVVSVILDLHWLGIYQMAKSLGITIFVIFSEIIENVFFSIFSNMKNHNAFNKQKIYNFIIFISLFGILTGILMFFMLPYVIHFLGVKWSMTLIPAYCLLFSGYLFFVSSSMYLTVMRALGNAKISALLVINKMILLTILSIVLGNYYGLNGILVAAVATEAIILVITINNLMKFIKSKELHV